MNWGELPSDLDLQVTQFNKSDPAQFCRTYYGRKTGCTGLHLDVDNTRGGFNGAETITWDEEKGDHIYLLFVHDYSGEWADGSNTTLVQSQARLTLYGEGVSIHENVPTEDPNTRSLYWVFGCFDVTNGMDSFNLVNGLTENFPPDNYSEICSGSVAS